MLGALLGLGQVLHGFRVEAAAVAAAVDQVLLVLDRDAVGLLSDEDVLADVVPLLESLGLVHGVPEVVVLALPVGALAALHAVWRGSASVDG